MSTEHERQRLQKLYAGMSDGELLKLAESKDELTAVAQQALDAEVGARGLAAPEGGLAAKPMVSGGPAAEDAWLAARTEPAAPEHSEAENDPSLAELMTFQIATEAEKALHELDDYGIPVVMEPALRRLTEDGPRIKTNWLTIFVERTRQAEAKAVLRKSMGLFPVLAPHEVDEPEAAEGGDDVVPVGTFDVKADAEIVKKALAEAGIWFKESHIVESQLTETVIEARMADLERALAVVEAAFAESE